MAINPNARKRFNEQRMIYEEENKKLQKQWQKRNEQKEKAAANKANDLLGAKDVEMLAQNERNKRTNPIQQGRQMVSNNIAKGAGVDEDVFAKIERDYLESIRNQEKNEEEFRKNFGKFFAEESSTTTQNQMNRFGLGNEKGSAVNPYNNVGEMMAVKAGGRNGVDIIRRKNAEKEYEKARKNKEDNFFPEKAQNTMSEEEFIRLLQFDEAKAEKEIENLKEELYNYGGTVNAVSAGTLGKANGVSVLNNPELQEEIAKLERDIAISGEVKKQNEYSVIQSTPELMRIGRGGYEKYQETMKNIEKEDHKLFEQMVLSTFDMPDMTTPIGRYQYMVNVYEDSFTENQPNDNWTDAEKNTFGYYWVNGDYPKATEYARRINNVNAAEKKQDYLESINYWAQKNPINSSIADAASVVATVFGGLNAIDKMAQLDAQGYIVENEIPFSDEIVDYLRSSKAENLDEKYGKGAGDIYKTVMEGADTAFVSSIGKAPLAVLFGFGSEATDAYKDAIARGATPEQALEYGIAIGAANAAIDMSLIGNNNAVFRKLPNYANEGITHAARSTASTVANTAIDNWIMDDLSKHKKLTAEYVAMGYSEAEAQRLALKDMGDSMLQKTISGIIGENLTIAKENG